MEEKMKTALVNKRTAGLVLLLAMVLGIALHYSGVWPQTLDSFAITLPGDAAADAFGVVLAPIILLCVALFLTLILSGVGFIVLGSLVLVGGILVVVALPFLLPLLIPVFIIWIAIVVARRRETAQKFSYNPFLQP
jgi:hypothetical protein